MKVLITGGTGFIGSEIGKILSRDHELYIVTRNKSTALDYTCTLINKSEISGLVSLDAVIHLAGETVAQRWTNSAKAKILQTRSQGTTDLIKELSKLKNKPKVFVAASAIGFYGDRHDEILTENSKKGSGFLSDVCEKWEFASQSALNLPARLVIFRIGMVLGKNGGALKKMILSFQMGLGGKIGSGKQWISWIHIQDLARLFQNAVEKEGYSGVYNAVSSGAVTNLEFSETLAEVLGRKLRVTVPEFAIKALTGEMSNILLSSQKVEPKRLSEKYVFQFSKLDAALKNILRD